MLELIEFIKGNFMHVAPIVASGVFAIAIFLERLRALFVVYPLRNPKQFFGSIQDYVQKGEVSAALALCDYYPNKPAAQIVKRALLRADQPEELIAAGLELEIEDSIEKVERRTPYLSTIANVATLFGLLGTIAGLIEAFKAVASADAQQKTTLLAAGISQAMNATMMGLAVAIPSMIAFAFLINKTNRLSSSIETSAVRILDIFRQRYFQSESKKGKVA